MGEQGFRDAQSSLAFCYLSGEGVRQDVDEAVRLYELAADHGDIASQRTLQRLKRQNSLIENSGQVEEKVDEPKPALDKWIPVTTISLIDGFVKKISVRNSFS